MSGIKNRFINSVMRAVISTPNLTQCNDETYDQLVIQPTKKIMDWSERLSNDTPDPAVAIEILRILRDIMEAKGISLDEQRDHVNEILKRHHLTDSCGHFLSEMFASKFARV